MLLPTLLEHIQHTYIKLTTYLYYLMTFPSKSFMLLSEYM